MGGARSSAEGSLRKGRPSNRRKRKLPNPYPKKEEERGPIRGGGTIEEIRGKNQSMKRRGEGKL